MDFKAKYSRNGFTEFFRDKLLPDDFQLNIETITPDFKSNYFKTITYLGKCRSLNLNVYEIYHTSEKDARVGLSRDAFKLVSRYNENNALILFVPENKANYRLSLVIIDPKLDEHGVKVLKEYSNPRRYSFVLGEDSKTHTPEQYLIGQGQISDLVDLKKRFSVEVVNKEFYGQIAEMFSKLVGGKRRKGNRTVEYERTLILPSVGSDNEQKHKEFAVRLIGRTVFCWFLKKKKSDKGIPLISNEVLSGSRESFTRNFYHERIEPLFFEVLNTAINKRKPEYKKEPFSAIPFLNGGLFEPHNDDHYLLNKPNYALKIPDVWWQEFLAILETYNFTIDENTSIDIDLSVDPEMLGRIFENLLAEINPETGETARKATGSYYTPRPIVEYMVDQSLKQYLVTTTNIQEGKIDILLDYSKELSGLNEKEERLVLEAINNVRILDPACGSGAFPMGMLQKMLLVLQKVDHGAETSIRQILKEIQDPIKREMLKRKLEAAKVLDDVDFDDYARKLNVIQRSIYGVDIQPIAADISRLRFFLSLIVDEVVQDEQPNRGVEPLPNLEFKFVCANTLIPLPEPDNFEKMFGDSEIVRELEEIRTKYFTASNDDKPAIRKQFEDLQKKLFNFLIQNKDVLNDPNSRLGMLSSWKPFSDEASEWFDSKWVFGISDGFDIVLGNPPYLGEKNNKERFHVIKRTAFGKKFYQRRMDYFYFFIIFGLQALKDRGVLSLITTNYWLTATGAQKFIRPYIKETSTFHKFIDFGEYKIFDSAQGQHNCIFIITKQKLTNGCDVTKVIKVSDNLHLEDILNEIDNEYINHYISQPQQEIYSLKTLNINFHDYKRSSLIEKIKKAGINKLSEFCTITGGLSTSADKVNNSNIKFMDTSDLDANIGDGILVLDKSELRNLNLDENELKFIKPFFKSTDISKYFTSKSCERYVIYATHVNAAQIRKSNKLYGHLLKFKPILENRSQDIELEQAMKRGDWFVLTNGRPKLNFETDKIVCPYRTKSCQFGYNNQNWYGGRDIYFLLDFKISHFYLLGVLNSNLIRFWLENMGKRKGNILELYPEPLKNIPIVQIENTELIEEIVKFIISNHDQKSYSKTLDLIVYKIYGLLYNECQIINPGIESLISGEDYERLDIEGLSKYEIR